MLKVENREELKKLRSRLHAERKNGQKKLISLCSGSGCGAYGTAKVHQALVEELAKRNLQNEVAVKLTGCHGFCEKGPIMVIHPEGIFYPQLKQENISAIVEETIVKGEIVKSLIFKDPALRKKITHEAEIPFYNLQKRIIFGKRNDRSNQHPGLSVCGWLCGFGKIPV